MAVGMCFRPSRPWNPEDGCAEMHFTAACRACSRAGMPMKVPLVPMQATKCVTRPSVCSMISGAGAFEMRLPVGRIVVLIGIKVAVRIGFVDLAAQADGAVGALAGIGEHHLRAVGLQDPLALDAKRWPAGTASL